MKSQRHRYDHLLTPLLTLALALVGAALSLGAPPAEAAAGIEGTPCNTTFFPAKVHRVWDKTTDIAIHRSSNVTLPPGHYRASFTRRAAVQTAITAGASYRMSSGIEASGLAGKVLGKAESKYEINVATAGSRTTDTRSEVSLGSERRLRTSATFVFFRGVERVRGKYSYYTCVSDHLTYGHVELRKGRWVSWRNPGSGAVRCGDPNQHLGRIAEVARNRGCN